MRLLRLQFQFVDPDDVAVHGDGWHLVDEPAIARLRGRELIALEELIDQPIIQVMRGFREEKTLPTMRLMWVALHRAGSPVEWPDFNPAVNTVRWEEAPEVPLDSGAEATPEPNSSAEPSTESAIS